MYTESDFVQAKKTMIKELVIAFATLIVFIVLMVVGLVTRVKLLAIASPLAGSWIFYTLLVVKCMPWIRYNKFLRNMKEGRRRVMECYYMDIAGHVRIVDGVQIHDVNASLDEEGEDVRLFYWDDDKPMPAFEKGQKVRITSFGNFITAIEAV